MKISKNITWTELVAELSNQAHEDPSFKKKFLTNPNAVFEEILEHRLPQGLKIVVHENTADTVHVTLPIKVDSTEEVDEAALEKISGGGGGDGILADQQAKLDQYYMNTLNKFGGGREDAQRRIEELQRRRDELRRQNGGRPGPT